MTPEFVGGAQTAATIIGLVVLGAFFWWMQSKEKSRPMFGERFDVAGELPDAPPQPERAMEFDLGENGILVVLCDFKISDEVALRLRAECNAALSHVGPTTMVLGQGMRVVVVQRPIVRVEEYRTNKSV